MAPPLVADICGAGAPVTGAGLVADEDPEGAVAAPGCMADEPVVVEPEPLATGRSVPPDGGGGVVWARAGAAAKAVATRQAAMCFFSMILS
jgi:hypothetical protein